jgi:hypothetical protein
MTRKQGKCEERMREKASVARAASAWAGDIRECGDEPCEVGDISPRRASSVRALKDVRKQGKRDERMCEKAASGTITHKEASHKWQEARRQSVSVCGARSFIITAGTR